MKTHEKLAEIEAGPPGIRIRLPRGEWFYDPSRTLGPRGGFGQVFWGLDPTGKEVAVKRLHVDAASAAHRELTIADDLAGRELKHVLPVLDAGQDAESDGYFVVMPRANGSLAEYIKSRGGPVDETEAVQILQDIVAGLIEVGDIVHRDLKPANVLMHDDRWKIADFGIARFVADATASNTLKGALSPPYAAPEQWNGERATHATDTYALACVAHVLVTGKPPFSGPSESEFQQQHLLDAPAPLLEVDPRLRSIVAAALRKPHSGRPSIQRIATLLQEIAVGPKADASPLHELRRVNAIEAERIADAMAKAEADKKQQSDRDELLKAAAKTLDEIMSELETVARVNASEAQIAYGRKGLPSLRITMGNFGAKLVMELDGGVPFGLRFTTLRWDPIAIGQIRVIQRGGNEWSHGATLWFMRVGDGEYRWYEVSYQKQGFAVGVAIGPFPIQDTGKEMYTQAVAAAGQAMHIIRIDFGPTPIDDENMGSFIERWLARLAAAYQGKLAPF